VQGVAIVGVPLEGLGGQEKALPVSRRDPHLAAELVALDPGPKAPARLCDSLKPRRSGAGCALPGCVARLPGIPIHSSRAASLRRFAFLGLCALQLSQEATLDHLKQL
jgi:hypothetical protein